MTDRLYVWNADDTATVELPPADQPRAILRRRGYRRQWKILQPPAGQLLDLTPVRGSAPPTVVHASELLLVRLEAGTGD